MIQDKEDLLQILDDQNKIPRSSNGRSSILKNGIPKTMKRNSRRVSWAQTFQYQELRSDGTSVISSQKLNKYGPQVGPKSLEIDVLSCNNKNAPANSQVGLKSQFWKNKSNENELINDENDEDNHTVHETTMIIVDSSDSDNMDIDMENKTIETSPSSSQDDNDTDDVGGLFKPMLQENEQCSDTAQFSFEIEPATTDKNPQPLSMNNQHEKVEQIKPVDIILNEEGIEFGNSIDKSGVQENTKINDSKSVSVATKIGSESTDKKIPSPPMKRPYDFTLMNALLPEAKKVAKQTNRSLMSFRASTNLNMTTSPLSKASISLANNKTINRRIETTSIPLNVSKQTFNAKTSIVNQNVKNCIELNFNNSQNENQNLDTSLQNVDTLIKKCVRKSCGFDLTEKLRMKSKQLIEERKQCDNSKHETQNHATNVKDSNDITICFDSNAEPEKNLTLTVNMESVVNNSDNAKNNEEAEESPLDISNISNLDILQNSIEFNDSDFKTDSKEDNKSDSSLLELEKMFQSIGSIGARSRRMSSNSLDETVFEKTFSNELKNLNLSFVNEIVDQTSILSSFSTDSFSSKLDYYEISKNRALKRFNARTSNHPIYHSISNLDYKAIHIRIYSLDSNEFIIRFLWGTVEVRINFNDDCEPIRPMSINIVSLLNQKPIQYEEMRGLYNDQNRPLFDGDDMFLRFEEKHRSILQMGHDYILRHFHERYPQLTKMYANSNRLLELLTELSSIANTARSLTNEVRDIYSAVITELLPSVEDKFSLSIKFLGAYVDTNVDMVISFVPYNYPDEVIHPVIIVPEGEEELYEMENFKAELLNVKNGELHYLYRLVNTAHSYIIRIRNKIRQQHRLEKQKKEFAATKTLQSD
ncbi:hypothetical protein BLOT_011673 [Blomia tropicalis]|nr:hypothetical protein BLOT_011673 [Blomia tropicalis]